MRFTLTPGLDLQSHRNRQLRRFLAASSPQAAFFDRIVGIASVRMTRGGRRRGTKRGHLGDKHLSDSGALFDAGTTESHAQARYPTAKARETTQMTGIV